MSQYVDYYIHLIPKTKSFMKCNINILKTHYQVQWGFIGTINN